MEISAQLSPSIYHSTSNTRNASCDKCCFDGDLRRIFFRLVRSHKSSSVRARKLSRQSRRFHRTPEDTADVQLVPRSSHRRISASFESIRLFPASVGMLDADGRSSLHNKAHRRKLNWAEVTRAGQASSRRPGRDL